MIVPIQIYSYEIYIQLSPGFKFDIDADFTSKGMQWVQKGNSTKQQNKEAFEDIKGAMRIRKSKNDRQ